MKAVAAFAALDAPPRVAWVPQWWTWPVVGAAIVVLGLMGAVFTPVGGSTAAWWPAAGVAALFALQNPERRRRAVVLLVFAVTIVPNLWAGRSLPVSLGYALANAVEIVALLAVLALWGHRGSRRFVLRRTQDALVLVVAALAGAAAAGLVGGATAALLGGGNFFVTSLSILPSHAAAVLLIAPFACIPPGGPETIPRWEALLQPGLLLGVLALALTPLVNIPLTFLPFMVIAWGCLRLPFAVALAEVLIAGVGVLAITLAGRGPFAVGVAPSAWAVTVEIFLIALATVALLMLTARSEQREAARIAARTSQLLSGGFVEAQVGLAIARLDPRGTRLVWANQAGRTLLAPELDADVWSGPLERAARTASADGVEGVDTQEGTSIRLVANPVEDDPTLIAVQLLDVTGTMRIMQARAEAERERDAAAALRHDLDRQREDFVATTSHELRTPITNVLGYAELLDESPALSELERDWVARISRNGQRLSDLVEDLLMVGGADAAPAPTTARRTLPAERLVDEIVAAHHTAAAHKGLRVDVTAEPAAAVHAMPADVQRVLGALVSNAILFTSVGGSIRIDCRTAGETTEIEIVDSGPGLAAEHLERVFERFYRAPEAEHASTPGTGLGLSIAQRLAHRNGGEVVLDSPVGGGLRAVVSLPSAPALSLP